MKQAELCREHGVSSASVNKWRSKYGGIDTALMPRMNELEAANARLKKMYAEKRLKDEVVREAFEKSGEAVSPTRDSPTSSTRGRMNVCQACMAFGISETSYRQDSKRCAENDLIGDWTGQPLVDSFEP